MTDTLEKPFTTIGHLVPSDEQYPEILRKRYGSKAPELWYIGNLDLLNTLHTSISVTGSRASTGYGEHVAMDFAAGFSSRGYTVITGGGYGIDGMGTRATLACGGNAIVVSPGGLNAPYPSGHSELFRRVTIDGGLLLSLYAPDTVPTQKAFEKSGRLLANLSAGVVVIEASLRGRGYETADYALRHRLNVCAVPGPITSASSSGSHKLIGLGAKIVTSVADVMDTLDK